MKLGFKFKVLRETEVIEGSKIYFIIIAVLYKLTFKSKQISRRLQIKLRGIVPRIFKRELVIRNKLGTFVVKADDSFSKSSFYFEEYLHEWLDRDSRKETFVDMGANIGFYPILALNKKGFKRAIAFEANPDTCKVLQKNIELSGLKEKVTAVCGGLGERSETLKFEKRRYHTGGSRFVDSGKNSVEKIGSEFSYVEVPIQSFDKYVEDNKVDLESISFIKIDVEGFELKVLKGMKNTLQRLKADTFLFVEIWGGNIEGEESLDLLKKSNFEVVDSKEANFLLRKK